MEVAIRVRRAEGKKRQRSHRLTPLDRRASRPATPQKKNSCLIIEIYGLQAAAEAVSGASRVLLFSSKYLRTTREIFLVTNKPLIQAVRLRQLVLDNRM